jgi:hypothetical protein
MAEEENLEEEVSLEMTLISKMTDVVQRMAVLQEVTLGLLQITTERIEAVETFQRGLSFEDMVDGKVPPQGMTSDQRERLLKLQEQLSERTPDLPHGI